MVTLTLFVIIRSTNSSEVEHSQIDAVEANALELLERGVAMEILRDRSDLSLVRQCGIEMRANQKVQSELRAYSEQLPFAGTSALKTAVLELRSCVSCSDDAIESCQSAKEYLDMHEHDKRFL